MNEHETSLSNSSHVKNPASSTSSWWLMKISNPFTSTFFVTTRQEIEFLSMNVFVMTHQNLRFLSINKFVMTHHDIIYRGCALQCVAVCCSVLQCVAVRCSALQCVAVRCSALQCVADNIYRGNTKTTYQPRHRNPVKLVEFIFNAQTSTIWIVVGCLNLISNTYYRVAMVNRID